MKSSFDTLSKNIYNYSHSNESTNTSCSALSQLCIEYDSDIESDDSIHFYTHSTEFVDNEFLRINHKPFLQLWRKQQEEKSENNKEITSISEIINKNLFNKINDLNKEIEQEYLLLTNKLLNNEKSESNQKESNQKESNQEESNQEESNQEELT